ncbi:type IV pilus twitching motility protein PilT [Rosenbergiella australiborealis]|uniref:type IV pilus twitching motility protein PilT n=1 Tax=Rosenbergiella australiborealis TaxID=1544696 RepID=UPI001F4EB4A9|nr:PilT/PilU family type 4a pilus ATPase [Rosenbergiella australiborealis]
MELTELVALSVKHNASDLHLCCGEFPRWRIQNSINTIPHTEKLTEAWFQAFSAQRLTPALRQQLKRLGHCDFAFSCGENIRLRASLFTQRQGPSLSLRLLQSQVIAVERVKLPSSLLTRIMADKGLFLVTGATGSGKTTTLTTLIDYLNRHCQRHIIMLEDPIEFCHTNHGCLIQQREIGDHLSDLNSGIIAALRQDPDIIVIGELRDKKTIQLALSAAETGHLVLATLHSTDTMHALQRLVEAFSPAERDTTRHQLAQTLSAVLAQQLWYEAEQVNVVFELLLNTTAMASLIREGKFHQIPGQLEQANQEGMVSFRQSIARHLTPHTDPVETVTNRDFQTNFLK